MLKAGASDELIGTTLGRTCVAVRSKRQALRLRPPVRELAMHPGWAGGANSGRVYWTDRRVAAALRAYARAHPGALPRGTPAWDELTRGDATLPVSSRILRQYGALGNAWRTLLPAREIRGRLQLQWVRYTAAEDEFIRERASRMTMTEIAEQLGRTEASVTMHARRTLGVVTEAMREWWSPRDVAEHYGCPLGRVYGLVYSGRLRAKRTGRVRIDSRDLRAVEQLLRAPSQRTKKVLQLRRHKRAGHNDVITRAVSRTS